VTGVGGKAPRRVGRSVAMDEAAPAGYVGPPHGGHIARSLTHKVRLAQQWFSEGFNPINKRLLLLGDPLAAP
jgi:hypothetical protein